MITFVLTCIFFFIKFQIYILIFIFQLFYFGCELDPFSLFASNFDILKSNILSVIAISNVSIDDSLHCHV